MLYSLSHFGIKITFYRKSISPHAPPLSLISFKYYRYSLHHTSAGSLSHFTRHRRFGHLT
jgi:hypothetical protein